MAINPTYPGVYIDEISTIPPAVAPVATAIPAFIGFTEKAEKNGDLNALRMIPTRISSFTEYEEIFGGPQKETHIEITVNDKINGPGGALLSRVISAIFASPGRSKYVLHDSVRLYYENGGGPCYIVSCNGYGVASVGTAFGSGQKTDLQNGIKAIEKVDEPTLLVMPETAFGFSGTNGDDDHYGLAVDMLSQCAKLKDRFTIIDVHNDDAVAFRTSSPGLGMNNLKYGAVYHPWLNTGLDFSYNDSAVKVTQTIDDGINTPVTNTFQLNTITTTNVGLYNQIKAEIPNQLKMTLTPSAAMAGIYATVDRERGVWKAPANVGLTDVTTPTKIITAQEQESLNVDPTSGKSINAIRPFTGKGILVWGARTLAGNDNEWRYVPVRRLFIFAEESIQKATEFVVFEPNDANTWTRVKTLIGNFLTNLWRDGALAGATPDDAFFINVGLGETMTPQDILEGKLIIQVGLAAVRPAEFIILQFMHKLQES